MHFLVGARSEVQNQFWNQFSNKVLYYSSIFFLEAFRAVFKKGKNGFSIVFLNLARKGSGVYFHATVLFFHQMPCINLLNNRGSTKFWLLTFDPIKDNPTVNISPWESRANHSGFGSNLTNLVKNFFSFSFFKIVFFLWPN